MVKRIVNLSLHFDDNDTDEDTFAESINLDIKNSQDLFGANQVVLDEIITDYEKKFKVNYSVEKTYNYIIYAKDEDNAKQQFLNNELYSEMNILEKSDKLKINKVEEIEYD